MTDTDHHELSIWKVFKPPKMPSRLCHKCFRQVRLVVGWKPLCRKHAVEEFIQNLKGFIEGRLA